MNKYFKEIKEKTNKKVEVINTSLTESQKKKVKGNAQNLKMRIEKKPQAEGL